MGRVKCLDTRRLTTAARRIVASMARNMLFRTERILSSMTDTEREVLTTAMMVPSLITGRAIYSMVLSRVELYLRDIPSFPLKAVIISGRVKWFSMRSVSPKESPITVPDGRMTVTLVPVLSPMFLHWSLISLMF